LGVHYRARRCEGCYGNDIFPRKGNIKKMEEANAKSRKIIIIGEVTKKLKNDI